MTNKKSSYQAKLEFKELTQLIDLKTGLCADVQDFNKLGDDVEKI